MGRLPVLLARTWEWKGPMSKEAREKAVDMLAAKILDQARETTADRPIANALSLAEEWMREFCLVTIGPELIERLRLAHERFDDAKNHPVIDFDEARKYDRIPPGTLLEDDVQRRSQELVDANAALAAAVLTQLPRLPVLPVKA